ncbi:MAG: hypothetical protein OWS74_05090, partial [Firmicutes bacterium]|nr:hypothetical protein [Bacillota bacterium]
MPHRSHKRLALSLIGTAFLLATLNGCGTAPAPTPSAPPLIVHVSSSDTLLALPVYLTQALHQFAAFHLSVRLVHKAGAVSIAPAGQHWPLYGQIATGPELVLISDGPDPHFRLSRLSHHGLYFSPQAPTTLTILHQALFSQHIVPAAYLPISLPALRKEWPQHTLSYVVLSLQQWAQLRGNLPNARIIHWFGADTGPVPAIAVSATHPLPQMAAFLAAVNVGLQILYTEPVQQTAAILSPVLHKPPGQIVQ